MIYSSFIYKSRNWEKAEKMAAWLNESELQKSKRSPYLWYIEKKGGTYYVKKGKKGAETQ